MQPFGDGGGHQFLICDDKLDYISAVECLFGEERRRELESVESSKVVTVDHSRSFVQNL